LLINVTEEIVTFLIVGNLQEMETLRRQMDQIFDEMVNVNREAQMTWKACG